MIMIISDLDGVVLASWGWGDYAPRPGPRPGPADAILTNQGGVPLRWCRFPWAAKYPTLRQVLARVRAGMRLSGAKRALVALYHPKQEHRLLGRALAGFGKAIPILPLPVPEGIIFLSFAPKARKPSPWGLLWLARGREAIFFGDEESDAEAARQAGVAFVKVSPQS